MQANDASFSNVIGAFQYEIPYFQRSYVWKQEQLTKFAEDMLYISDEYAQYLAVQQQFEYFMGTIISKPKPAATGYQILNLIDGQQRVTTFAVFFKAMSLVYGNPTIYDSVFRFPYGLINPTMVDKLVSSAVDQPIMRNIMALTTDSALDKNGLPLPVDKKWNKRMMHPLYVAYNYFRDFLKDLLANNHPIIPDNIIYGVKFINMTLSGNDDEQVYFDNINSLGVRLTTSAIIKNYIFSSTNTGYQDYKNQWEPIFEGSNHKYWNSEGNRSNIDEFLFYYLQAKTYDVNLRVSAGDKKVYSRRDAVANHIKALCDTYMGGNKNTLLIDIIRYADTYSKIVLDDIGTYTLYSNESTIDDMLARMGYLTKKLKVSTLIPYLLFVVNSNPANSNDTYGILKYLESYLIRRSLIDANVDNYNKFFREILIGKNVNTLAALKVELCNTHRSTDMPTDAEILQGLSTLDYEGDNETPKALLYMYELALNRRNNSHVAILAPNSYTLEHLMPQNLNPAHWPGPNQSEDHVYKIGNMGLLTQSLQSSIKNYNWATKLNGYQGKPGIRVSCGGLHTMAFVANQPVWNDMIIDSRTLTIVNDMIAIWSA